MAERGLSVAHTTFWRWAQTYVPEVHRRLQGEVKPQSSRWHREETFVGIAGKWMYLFRAVDGQGQTCTSTCRRRVIAKLCLKKDLANPDNRPPHLFARDRPRCASCQPKDRSPGTADSEHGAMPITESNRSPPRVQRLLRALQGPRMTATAWAVIQGIEAAYMLRKRQGPALPAPPAREGVALRNLTRRCINEFLSKVQHFALPTADATLPPARLRIVLPMVAITKVRLTLHRGGDPKAFSTILSSDSALNGFQMIRYGLFLPITRAISFGP
jgi:transposase-like protein